MGAGRGLGGLPPAAVRNVASDGPQSGRQFVGQLGGVRITKAALQEVGVEVRGCDDPDRVGDAGAALGSGVLDCYIQAPYDVIVEPGTDVERFRDLLAGGLLARTRTAATLIPRLRAGATIVLVAGGPFPDSDVPDDPRARFDLLRVLGEAIRAAHSAGRVVVTGSSCSVAEIVAAAVPERTTPEVERSQYAILSSDMSYAEWKRELLTQTSEDDWERAIVPVRSPVE